MIMAWSMVAVLYSILLMFYAGRKIQYTLFEQIKDVFPYFLLALLMGIGIFFFSFLIKNCALLLITQLTAGATFYLGATYLLGSKVFRDIIQIVKNKTFSAE